jgi:acetoin utilization protein AcuB
MSIGKNWIEMETGIMDTLQVKHWMTPDPITVAVDNNLSTAYHLMRLNHIRRLPVVNDQERLVGIITWGDIRNARTRSNVPPAPSSWEAYFLAGVQEVRDYMTPAPITVTPDTPIRSAVSLMLHHKIGGLPVVEAHQLVGVLSETDVFRFLLAYTPEAVPAPE